MTRMLRWAILAVTCGLLALSPDLPGGSRAARRVVYALYATDGYAHQDDGTTVHYYGFVGGRVSEPLTYLDANGTRQTTAEGLPAPVAGPVTSVEAALAGHAQLPAPVLWASSNDVVEVRLKNLGSRASALAPAVGFELRGAAVTAGAVADGRPAVALPAHDELPGAGNLLVYTFRIPQPGTYAYGWGDLGHELAGGAVSCAACPCCRRAAAMGSGPAAAGTDDPLYSALAGALVIYDAADAAAQVGTGAAAGGALLGLRYDRDYVMLISGAARPAGGQTVAAATVSRGVLVNGLAPADSSAGRPRQPGYAAFDAAAERAGGRVLVRVLNLSARPQPIAAVTLGHKVVAYQARTLARQAATSRHAAWAEGGDLRTAAVALYPAAQPGEAVDVLLDLAAPREAAPAPGFLAAAMDVVSSASGGHTMAGMDMSGMAMPTGMAASCPLAAGATAASLLVKDSAGRQWGGSGRGW